MRRVLFAGAVMLALGALPKAADAAPAWLGAPVCTTGGLVVCASVDTWMVGNNLYISVTNLYPGRGLEHSITAFGFRNVTLPPSWTAVSLPSGWTLQPTGNSAQDIWNGPGGTDLQIAAGTNGIKNGIGAGETSLFIINVGTTVNPLTNATELRWHSQGIGGEDGPSIKCDTGISQDEPGSSYPGCSVVPEPFTMALLGTGLVGVGGAALRRRRKGMDVVSD